MKHPSTIDMTIRRERTPEDIRSIMDNISEHLEAIVLDFNENQRRMERKVEDLDERLRYLEREVITLVNVHNYNDMN